MGKKKFIDKKKSATFSLMARDTSDPNYSTDPSGERVFVRVDNNQYTPESSSIFADAPEDDEDEYGNVYGEAQLPEKLRKEILELGFPDDGYNYLSHLREITHAGGGSAYYQNPKANFQLLPRDVKAYDASKVELPKENVVEEKLVSNVASKAVAVKLQRVLDPEVAALLDDSDMSKYGSDVEDLDEDFVTKANVFEGLVDEDLGQGSSTVNEYLQQGVTLASGQPENGIPLPDIDSRPPRSRRPLDEQFDMLELQDYGTDSEGEYADCMDEEEGYRESLAEKLNYAFKDRPSDILQHELGANDTEDLEATPDVIQRCKEYGEVYENEDVEVPEFLEEDSSDESEVWDCETIVSTYSTLDNHPGKIGAPERRPKKLAETATGVSAIPSRLITLKGKEMLPVDFLPRSKRHSEDKTKEEKDSGDKQKELLKRKPRSQESKEEKKERKSAVKSERREARQMKKEMRGLYKFESQRAQKVAAFTGPSSIHLM